MLNTKRIILLFACLTILFVVPFADAQEPPTVLKPNQLITFSLAPEQEKLFVLQMKEGDFADLQWVAREDLNLSFEIYDPAREKILEKPFDDYEASMWFVAPRDGDFILISKLDKAPNIPISGAERISIQYNNKFKLPVGTKQEAIRRMNGYDVRIMRTPGTYAESKSVVLIEKNRQLKRILKSSGGDPKGFSFPYPDYLTKADTAYMTKAAIAKEKRIVSLIKSTIDKTGDGIPDVMISYFSGGAHCCFETFFINMGETVETVESLGQDGAPIGIDIHPKGGLLYRIYDGSFLYWLTSYAHSPRAEVILEFKNAKLRPNFDQMKKPAPSLAALKNKADFYRQKLNFKPYRGVENYEHSDSEDPFYNEDTYPNNEDEKYRGAVYRNVVFWGPMLDLIYTGHEDLSWQFLDLVWPPQKQGKALFIRDFKNQLLESDYWKMILEDRAKALPTTAAPQTPKEVVELWNEALKKGETDLALSLTSATSSEYIYKSFGSIEGLSKIYQRSAVQSVRTLIDNETIEGDVAHVIYTTVHNNGSIRRWKDRLLREKDKWKVAPQFVQSWNINEPSPSQSAMTAEDYFKRGNERYQSKQYDEAIADYTEAIQMNPKYADAYNNRASAYDNQGNLSQAIADYTKAIQLNSQNSTAFNNRGIIYKKLGNINQAMADYTKAIEIRPDFAKAYHNRGNAYTDQGSYSLAIADYTQAIQFDPKLAEPYAARGLAYRRNGNVNQAITDYTKAIQINPRFIEAYINRARAYCLSGYKSLAQADEKKAIALGGTPTVPCR